MTLEVIIEKLTDWALTKGVKLVIGLLVLFVGWKLIKKVVKTLSLILDRHGFDETLHSFLRALVENGLKILLVFGVMSYVGIATTSIAAIVTSAGLAIGLALQGSLSNFAGGVIILLMRPFNVGDFVDTAGHTGRVENIRIFYTYLVTPDNKEIMIPNGTIVNDSIVNYSRKDTRRVDLVFGASYDADVLHVKRVLSELVDSDNRILRNPEPFINICEHGASSVNFAVRVWTTTENYWDVYFYLLEQAKIKFDDEEISIPYPQMDLHIRSSEKINQD